MPNPLPDEELQAIHERDTNSHRTAESQVETFRACRDRRKLLAEVDRLKAKLSAYEAYSLSDFPFPGNDGLR